MTLPGRLQDYSLPHNLKVKSHLKSIELDKNASQACTINQRCRHFYREKQSVKTIVPGWSYYWVLSQCHVSGSHLCSGSAVAISPLSLLQKYRMHLIKTLYFSWPSQEEAPFLETDSSLKQTKNNHDSKELLNEELETNKYTVDNSLVCWGNSYQEQGPLCELWISWLYILQIP